MCRIWITTGIALITFLSSGFVSGQTLEDWKLKKQTLESSLAPLQAEINRLQGEINSVDVAIASLPGSSYGIFGTLGIQITGRNQWFAAGDLKDSRTAAINGSLNAFAHRLRNKYFWRNHASLTLGWQKLKTTRDVEAPFKPISDIVSVSSLFGYKISSKMASSSLIEYRSSVIRNWNNPGYIDAGIGMTYSPDPSLYLVIHPLNYNLILASDTLNFTSSLGCKVNGEYKKDVLKQLHWRSNLTGFISYKNSSPSLHNGTWTNWLTIKLMKGLGIGLEFALRYSEQEIRALQTYYTAGVSYSL
ncbi:MAG: DUF3078 domain-containing protein [Saprospiraceae bacterium]|nr:DUF3078 domain-containing protein [Saprospiraceae bacterium]